jgi:enoyl-[acyl-carrier-protein] reductase (NADH)
VLGTVGVASPLFNIRKVFVRAWQIVVENAGDNVDETLIDRMESEFSAVLDQISSIDFQIYSVGFTEMRETKENLIASSKVALDEMINQYRLFVADFPEELL